MQFNIQLTITNPENGKTTTEQICLLEKQQEQLEDIGLSLQESKDILQALQEKIVHAQVDAFVEAKRACEHCGKNCRKKGSYPIVFRTLFNDLPLDSPRFYTCTCQSQQTRKTFSPLSELMSEHTAPERLYLETKWATVIPFGKTVELLKDVLPMNDTLNATSVRNHLVKVAEKDEAQLGEEQYVFIDGCQRDWNELPKPDGTIVVGLDGGYLRLWKEKGTKFEVIAGKSLATDRADKCFAFVDTYEPSKPKRRVFETLKSQGMQANQAIEFLSDGATNLHELQKFISPLSEHYLDWFHITMKITVLHQYLKGLLKVDEESAKQYQEYLEKIKWYLWHGNVPKALFYLDYLADAYSLENNYQHLDGFKKHAAEFVTYIRNNQGYITNYGERFRNGEIYTTSFTEATINEVVSRRFCKKQQRQWTKKGAHAMLQTRAKVLNEELEECFRQWYPNFRPKQNQQKAA